MLDFKIDVRRVPRVFSYMYDTRTCRGRRGACHNLRNFLTDCFQTLSQLRTFFTDCSRTLTRPSLPTGPCFRIYTTSVSGEEAVEPETISETSSPVAFKFRHNLAFKYARIFRYIRTFITGEEAVEPETISESSSPIAFKF
jgi:hypothetical protein